MRSVTSKRWASSLLALALIAPAACTPGKQLHGVHQDFAGGTVKQMGLLTPTFGYALTDGRFVSTEDGGKNWNDLTPVDAPAATLRAGYFYDQARAWAVVYNDATRKLVIYRSASGGASWKTVELPETHPADPGTAEFSFISPTNGWLAISDPHELYRTTDGGETWTKLSLPGDGPSEIKFIGMASGYAVTGSMHDHLFQTLDGGTTWTERKRETVTHSCPYGAGPAACGDASGPRFSLPGAYKDGEIAATTYVEGNPELVIACARAEGFTGLTPPIDDRVPVSYLEDGGVMWWWNGFIRDDVLCVGRPYRKESGGKAAGLPSVVTALSFVDPLNGWAVGVATNRAKATPSTPGSTEIQGLYATADGGKTWTQLQP